VRIHPQMKRGVPVLLASAVVLAAAVFASGASSLDRLPVTIAGTTPDGWGYTTTGAERDLHRRFAGIENAYCVGAILAGHERDSSWLDGGTRYWDKLACKGTLWKQHGLFTLVYDAKGADGWTVYRLKGASIRQLYGG
jgi:hypothetical protein